MNIYNYELWSTKKIWEIQDGWIVRNHIRLRLRRILETKEGSWGITEIFSDKMMEQSRDSIGQWSRKTSCLSWLHGQPQPQSTVAVTLEMAFYQIKVAEGALYLATGNFHWWRIPRSSIDFRCSLESWLGSEWLLCSEPYCLPLLPSCSQSDWPNWLCWVV